MHNQKYIARQKAADPSKFAEKQRKRQQDYKSRRKIIDHESLKKYQREAQRKCREMKKLKKEGLLSHNVETNTGDSIIGEFIDCGDTIKHDIKEETHEGEG